MPWFPEFTSAVELARRQTRAAGQADPVAQYLAALSTGDTHALQTVELLAHLTYDGREMAWPIAVVAESPDPWSVVFRTYCSQWPVDGRRHVRPPILPAGSVRPGDIVGRYQAALEAGDAEAIVSTFAPEGYFREPIGPHYAHRGPAELRSFFTTSFSAGGGIGLQDCAVTDDGVRCAVEYDCVRWAATTCRPGGNRGLRARPGRAAGRGSRLRRRRATRRARLSVAGCGVSGLLRRDPDDAPADIGRGAVEDRRQGLRRRGPARHLHTPAASWSPRAAPVPAAPSAARHPGQWGRRAGAGSGRRCPDTTSA
ncbi:MAG: nuclear transport factor 2 family protein [Actinomycetota bacterium]|nr:nuclear transport factor 2 family protein [Actinomycetota bacterium]